MLYDFEGNWHHFKNNTPQAAFFHTATAYKMLYMMAIQISSLWRDVYLS